MISLLLSLVDAGFKLWILKNQQALVVNQFVGGLLVLEGRGTAILTHFPHPGRPKKIPPHAKLTVKW